MVGPAMAPSWSRPVAAEPLTVRLVCATDSVQPGKPLRVGLYFQLARDWHIYWRNPGDSGEPPRVRWRLPAGFRAGALQWPAPERLGSGSVIDFGYRESVLLPVELQPPATPLAPGSSITVSAEVSWLACKDVCLPGKAVLTLTLPVRRAPAAAPAAQALFRQADSRLPRPVPKAWRTEATAAGEFLVLTIRGAGAAKAAFFPFEPDQVDHAAAQTTTPIPGGLRLALRKSDQLATTPASLDGVLELDSGRSYALSVPVLARTNGAAPP